MVLLEDVFGGYLQAVAAYGRVPGTSSDPAIVAIRDRLPSNMRQIIGESGRAVGDYRAYGSVGQNSFHFAAIPWVACCRRDIGTSVKIAYFIVLLFRQDMMGCWLSLNQGYTQYEDAFGSEAIARRQARAGADLLARMIAPPAGFQAGPIELGASKSFGRGYEAGAICSRFYDAAAALAQTEFEADFLALLQVYDDLADRAGRTTISLLPDSDEVYQSASAALAKSADLPPLPAGPQAPPNPNSSSSRGGYRRNPLVAAHAMKNANFACEWDASHETFVARRTKQNFVEAHHLVPMSEQTHYGVSLDVAENVIALCPTCHRRIHHSAAQDRIKMALRFLTARAIPLQAKGIQVSEASLRELYKHQLEED